MSVVQIVCGMGVTGQLILSYKSRSYSLIGPALTQAFSPIYWQIEDLETGQTCKDIMNDVMVHGEVHVQLTTHFQVKEDE